jgi:hypothetical protein
VEKVYVRRAVIARRARVIARRVSWTIVAGRARVDAGRARWAVVPDLVIYVKVKKACENYMSQGKLIVLTRRGTHCSPKSPPGSSSHLGTLCNSSEQSRLGTGRQGMKCSWTWPWRRCTGRWGSSCSLRQWTASRCPCRSCSRSRST